MNSLSPQIVINPPSINRGAEIDNLFPSNIAETSIPNDHLLIARQEGEPEEVAAKRL